MGAYDQWCAQKQKLRQEIQDVANVGSIAYAVKHALAQVEQNTMAQQGDDLLRQQTGILFSCVKTSVSLLDVSVATKVWVPQSYQSKKKKPLSTMLLVIAALVHIATGLYSYTMGLWIVWIPLAAVLVLSALALAVGGKRRKQEAPSDQVKVTLRPDEEKLLRVIDQQTQAIDRYINDFAYLNEQHGGQESTPDSKMIARVADMLEALYECDDDAMQAVQVAAQRMLDVLGLAAEPYSADNHHLFTLLPSKSTTKTMVPALVAKDDHRLLRRGVAAVGPEQATGASAETAS